MRYASKYRAMYTSYGGYTGFKQQMWPSRSFKGIDTGAVL